MNKLSNLAALLCAAILPGTLTANPVSLTLADPQPKAGSLAPGLAVKYSYPGDLKTLSEARRALDKKSVEGTPLAGLNYDDTKDGDPVLTSGKTTKLAADISGYIKLDRAGSYTFDFLNNDGLQIFIGEQEVGSYDGIHACGYAGEIEVEVPKAGYYALQATYFQRKGTACLMMEWGPDSDGLELVPDSIFFHMP